MKKDIMFIENCPICNQKLKEVLGNDGFVIDFWCGNCSHSWTLEDLEYEPIQQDITSFF